MPASSFQRNALFLGMSAAAGVYQSVVGLVLVIAANWLVRRSDPDKALF